MSLKSKFGAIFTVFKGKEKLMQSKAIAKKANPEKSVYADVDPEKLDPDELAVIDAFKTYDINKNGVIDKTELAQVLEAYHGFKPTPKQLGKLMSKVDLNQNGVVDLFEFKKMMGDRRDVRDDVKAAFDEWDKNHDGVISKEELHQMLNKVEKTDMEEVEQILAMADLNKDGVISFEEFLKFFV